MLNIIEPMRLGRWLIVAILAVSLAGWFVFDGPPKSTQPISQDVMPTNWKAQLREGDIVFRRGKEAVSDAVLALDPRSVYSHVGIVVFRNGEPMVVHAVPADAQDEEDVVRLEPVTRFIAPDRSSRMAVFRLKEASDQASGSLAKTAAQEALRLAQAHTPFDNAFDLDTPDQLYCTELVWHVFRKAGIDLAPNPPSKRFMLWSGRYIPPSALQSSPLIERVCC